MGLSRAKENTVANVIERHDRDTVYELLEKGQVKEAEKMMAALIPPYDPAAVDSRGRKLKKPKVSIDHLRARARVYEALKQWDQALIDAGEVASEQFRVDSHLSLRSEVLDRDEAYFEELKEKKQKSEGR